MLKGYGKVGSTLDSRLPITIPILQQLCVANASANLSHFDVVLFKAMCLVAFFAFLRLGKFTVRTDSDASKVLQLSQISRLVDSNGHLVSFKVTFSNFKHSYNQRPFSLLLSR